MIYRKLTISKILILAFVISMISHNQYPQVYATNTDISDNESSREYTNESLEASINNLSDAIEELKTANSTLETKVTSSKSFFTEANENKYTPNTYTAFKKIIDDGEVLNNQNNRKISSASTTLDSIKEEYTAAKEAADSNESDKTIPLETLKAIQQKAEAALAELSVDETLTAITSQINEIQSYAKNSLKVQADKTALIATINKAKAKVKSDYFDEEYNAMLKVISDVETVCNDKNASSAEVTAANKSLTAAIKALRVIYTQSGNTRYYNIANFQAFGNDTADDDSAIQTALNLASEDYKIVINFPKGTYYITKALNIHSNTTLNLNSQTVIFRKDSALGANMLRDTDSNGKMGTSGGYKLAHDIVLNGGTWDGGNISKSTKACNLLYFGHCDGLTLSNATIKNCYGSHALELAGVQNATVENCLFTGFRYGTGSYTSEAIQMDICWKSNSDGDWAPGFKQDKTTCKNISIKNNTIIDYPRGVGTHHYLSGYQYSGLVIQNNNIYRSSASAQGKCITGVFLVGVKSASVKSNTVNSYYYGIWIKQSSGLTVKSNTLKYNSYYNILYDGNNVANKQVRFTMVEVKDKKVGLAKAPKAKQKKLYYTAPTMKKGYLKTGGKKYSFKKAKKYFTVKLKKKLKKNQKIVMYGVDKDKNKFYKTYYAN